MLFSTDDIFQSNLDEQTFNALAIELFKYQSKQNKTYRKFLNLLGYTASPKHFSNIPFLPIELFKTHEVVCQPIDSATGFFASSGTSGGDTSKHYIFDHSLYERSFLKVFNCFFGEPSDYHILALLPSYIEQGHSSLVYMVDKLISLSGKGGFYLYNHDELENELKRLEQGNQKSILFGVSYALLDFASSHSLPLTHCTIVETGGMKGRRKEWTKKELHNHLSSLFRSPISSEYGMTELFSQAYALSSEYFEPAPWMRVLVRDVYDPFAIATTGKGGLNIIDLANIHSCAFIETQDLGTVFPNHTFEVLGRIDRTQIRGCNLLVQ